MTPIDRNPDINLDTDEIPEGMYLVEGKRLMQTARYAKVPYGEAGRNKKGTNQTRLKTIGIIIRESDRERFDAAMKKKKDRFG